MCVCVFLFIFELFGFVLAATAGAAIINLGRVCGRSLTARLVAFVCLCVSVCVSVSVFGGGRGSGRG